MELERGGLGIFVSRLDASECCLVQAEFHNVARVGCERRAGSSLGQRQEWEDRGRTTIKLLPPKFDFVLLCSRFVFFPL